jgi:hypothetical protein
MLSSNGPGYCFNSIEGLPDAYARNTAWYYVVGNGRRVAVAASASFATMMTVWSGSPLSPPEDYSGIVECDFDPNFGTAHQPVVAWDSVDGETYWIQVGICKRGDNNADCVSPGPTAVVTMLSQSAPPPYDTRANAVDLQPVMYDNHGAGQEAEINTCNGTEYGSTVWLKWTAPTWGTAVLNLGGMAGVLSIRRAGSDAVVNCGAGAAEARVSKGETIYIQVGGDRQLIGYNEGHFSIAASVRDPDDDNDGFVNASDCQPGNPAINPGVPEVRDDGIDQNCNPADDVNLDRDGDHENRPADCDDSDPNRYPGNVEHRGDGHDENCIAGDDAARKPPTSGAFTVSGGRLQKFALNDALKGSRIVVSCRGPSCRRSKVVVAKRLRRNVKRLSLPRTIVGALRAGTVIRVEVINRPAWIGRRFQWRMTSSSTWQFGGFCQKSTKWRRC